MMADAATSGRCRSRHGRAFNLVVRYDCCQQKIEKAWRLGWSFFDTQILVAVNSCPDHVKAEFKNFEQPGYLRETKQMYIMYGLIMLDTW